MKKFVLVISACVKKLSVSLEKRKQKKVFLINRAWLAHPSWWTICQCQDCTESLETTIKQMNKYSEKRSTLKESLDNISQIMRINDVNFV